jgi:hypothetical protein
MLFSHKKHYHFGQPRCMPAKSSVGLSSVSARSNFRVPPTCAKLLDVNNQLNFCAA